MKLSMHQIFFKIIQLLSIENHDENFFSFNLLMTTQTQTDKI